MCFPSASKMHAPWYLLSSLAGAGGLCTSVTSLDLALVAKRVDRLKLASTRVGNYVAIGSDEVAHLVYRQSICKFHR